MSNFDFLKDFDETLWKLGNRIEAQVKVSPSGVKADATTFLEYLIKQLMIKAGINPKSTKSFAEKVDMVYRSELKMSNSYRQSLKNAYNYRSKIHDEFDEIEKHEFQDAAQLYEKLFYIVRKYYRDYNDEYDEYKGVPDFTPVEIDFSQDEVKVRDFNEIVDVKYDYCVVCGNPNHLNYSIYCHKCSTMLENANNLISIRNAFGKSAKFTKEDLIEFGIPEGYVNQFIYSMTRENMLKVAGRFITFNNMHLDEFLTKIDNYISVGELITRFKEDKISPADIRKSREYVLGSKKDETLYQFYKITKREIIKKFERDLLTTNDYHNSIAYTTITNEELKRWYNKRLGQYKKGQVNESFVVFNQLLIRDYLDYKREGILESEIKQRLNINDEIYSFWNKFDDSFLDNLKEIKIELVTKAIVEGKTKDEIIEYAGISKKEYENIVKVADFHNTDLAKVRNQEIESRKKAFVKFLKNNNLESSCHLAKFTLDDFYEYYDAAEFDSEFFTDSTSILMDKFLAQRRLGKTRQEATNFIGIKDKYVHRWLSRSMYADFRDEELRITVNLIIRGFKNNKTLDEIAELSDISVNGIERFLRLGARGDEIYKPLFEYYEENIIPQKLDNFLKANETKTIRNALEFSYLKQGEVDKYYELGKNGDERFIEFYEEFHDIKKGTYVYTRHKGKSHEIAMRESQLSEDEYLTFRDEFDDLLRKLKFKIVYEGLRDNKTSNVIAKMANCSVDDLYDWYFKGKDGDEDYVGFYENFHKAYVNASVVPMQEKIDNENANIDNLIR
ncbi:MAG: hypothetical protein IKF11_02210, partial [Methanobrevibacter sp.]|nr:hypothetical protein [Methanobrevibacter sp.]